MKVILYHPKFEKFKIELNKYNFCYESNYERLKIIIKDYDGLIAFGLDQTIDLSSLKWIQSLGAGVDWITNNPTIKEDTIVTRVTDGLEVELFEYTLAWILYYYQNIETHSKNQLENKWKSLYSTGIRDKKVLIIGTGQIGRYIGQKLNYLQMKVDGINSTGYQIEGFQKCFTFNDIIETSFYDVVVNVLPSTKETIKVLNANFFDLVKQDLFINIGRGNAVDIDVLVNKLNNQEIKMAVLDVFEQEPLSSSSPLWQTNNLHITPHVAGLTKLNQLVNTIIKSYEAVVTNKSIPNKVNIKKGY